MKKRWTSSRVFPLVFIVLFLLLVFFLFRVVDCGSDENCFNERFSNCERAKYVTEDEGNIFEYKIRGEKSSGCVVVVSVIEVNEYADQETKDLFNGKSMICTVPNNQEFTINALSYCTGPLKESMYELIIQKMYGVLAQSLGDIIYQLQE
jgi:hypothetical protein